MAKQQRPGGNPSLRGSRSDLNVIVSAKDVETSQPDHDAIRRSMTSGRLRGGHGRPSADDL